MTPPAGREWTESACVDSRRVLVQGGQTVNDSQSRRPADPADVSVLDRLAQLSPDLDGYPVNQLLDVFMSAEQRDRAQAHRLVDRCIVHWIHTLEGDLGAYPDVPGDALLKVQLRQRKARDALASLQDALSRLDPVHRNRGPAS